MLGLAGVALGAMTTDAAEGRHHRNVHALDVHRSGLVHHRVHARLAAPITPAAVRMAAQLPDEEATIILSTPEPGAVVTSTKPAPNTGHASETQQEEPAPGPKTHPSRAIPPPPTAEDSCLNRRVF